MTLGKCSEKYIHQYFVIYYNKITKKSLVNLQKFLKYTKSNINVLINEFNFNGIITSTLIVTDSSGFETEVLNNDVIIKLDLFDNEVLHHTLSLNYFLMYILLRQL